MVVTEETESGTQFLIPFDFFEDEERERTRLRAAKLESYKHLPRFENPENDNQRLFNMQFDYYNGKPDAINQMFLIMNRIAPKLVNVEMHKHKLKLSQYRINEIALDSTMLFIEQIKNNELVITLSFVAYLRLQVLKMMFGLTQAQRFEKWCLINHIDIFHEDTRTQESLKKRFEQEMNEKWEEGQCYLICTQYSE